MPYSIRYKIGHFVIGISFDNKFFYSDVKKYMDTVFPDSITFKTTDKRREDCRCFITSGLKSACPDGFSLRLSKHQVSYSKDFKKISIFLNGEGKENIKGSLPYLLYFVPFFLKNNAILEHCSSVIYKGYGFAFIGDPDVGKSTIARILSQKGAKILSDEMALFYPSKKQYFISPVWISSSDKKINISQSEPAPLKAIFFLRKGRIFSLRKLNFYDKLTMLYRNNFNFFMRNLGMQEDFCLTGHRLFGAAGCYQLNYDLSPRIFSLLDSLI